MRQQQQQAEGRPARLDPNHDSDPCFSCNQHNGFRVLRLMLLYVTFGLFCAGYWTVEQFAVERPRVSPVPDVQQFTYRYDPACAASPNNYTAEIWARVTCPTGVAHTFNQGCAYAYSIHVSWAAMAIAVVVFAALWMAWEVTGECLECNRRYHPDCAKCHPNCAKCLRYSICSYYVAAVAAQLLLFACLAGIVVNAVQTHAFQVCRPLNYNPDNGPGTDAVIYGCVASLETAVAYDWAIAATQACSNLLVQVRATDSELRLPLQVSDKVQNAWDNLKSWLLTMLLVAGVLTSIQTFLCCLPERCLDRYRQWRFYQQVQNNNQETAEGAAPLCSMT